ncbi:MAG: cadmium-translocating P-type ATPase [Micrococcales bacterium 73-15]|uniref:heavy metal translocating P-type ATPase n=1 Tax=Salana multivorans TaxID=120377 RepID=UPI00096551DD|nr:heavy metal translocating P-type ATPase [Salana multivorans]OJX95385.1 MAG: cadmium-translocating P-type ATPase [Micrococcales bacterium 73-15]
MTRLVNWVRRYPLLVATLAVGLVVLALAVADAGPASRWVATAWVVAMIAWNGVDMVRQLLARHVGLDVLALVAMIATLAVGEHVAALLIVLMLTGGEALEDYAERRAARELTSLLDRSPQVAHVVVDPEAGDDGTRDVPVAEVAVGDVLLVRPAEVVPVDCDLLSPAGELDESSLTGEPLPVPVTAGAAVLSGSVNGTQAVRVRATRVAADSQYQQIVALVAQAQSSRAPVVRLADRFAVPFTAVSLLIAGVAWWVSGEPTRFAEVLVLATPCPLLIAAPVAFLGGLSRSARQGVIVKGGAVLERLARVRAVAFDKTGTLTHGRPALEAVVPAAPLGDDELLRLAASAEQYSTHVLAAGIREAAAHRGLSLLAATEAREVATNGVSARIDGRTVVVGKRGFVAGVVTGDVEPPALAPGQVAAYVAVDGRFAGVLVLADDVRAESAPVVSWLRGHGVAKVAMLTGDAGATARAIAERVGITQVNADLLPADKVRLCAELSPRPVMMVGDGVNDAPVLAAADVGVAMGARGATAAGEAADAVVLQDDLGKVPVAVAIGQQTVRVALTAIWIGIGLSLGLMLVATTGAIPAVAGALTQELVDLAAILYALRALGGALPAFPRVGAGAGGLAGEAGGPAGGAVGRVGGAPGSADVPVAGAPVGSVVGTGARPGMPVA